MNVVTFNEQMGQALKVLRENPNKPILNSPLIVWEPKTINGEDAKLVVGGGIKLPFQQFRVSMKDIKAWIEQINGEVFAYIWHKQMPEVVEVAEVEFLGVDGLYVKTRNRLQLLELSTGEKITIVGKEPIHINDEYKQSCEKRIESITQMILMLAVDFQNPHFHLCKKSPPIPQGKSVLWQKAREHYVLLHKAHPANRVESIGKKIITDGPTIDRMAHSRRAHFRMLRSPKFKHKQGQRVWIKSSWVGPKGWTDRAGQIYKIVEDLNNP